MAIAAAPVKLAAKESVATPLTSPAVTGLALIFTRICAVAGTFAVSPAATTGIVHIVLMGNACRALANLATMKN